MGFFSKILDKLGFDAGNNKVDEMLKGTGTSTATVVGGAAPTSTASMGGPAAVPMKEVDVVAQLDAKAAANSQKLNWKTSIVDLLKLLDLDSSLAARKELAGELNVRAGADGSAEQNMALHKAVLAKLAANGGNVPKELL
ncbi:DUF3597 domain-containing protein [Caenimonas sedimenti]|uniref:DUF3597 domain-containing protein n=1 Tax=Caenimonas sedimenti TaxID=2596921 RepID=A0A562ZNB4_9BURK|nr:DUF3597 domain-containing protein [Caenimonas sedimenti]TWO69808.1 DUF3597 domain-containing protein [Caenimonas sedimenti]